MSAAIPAVDTDLNVLALNGGSSSLKVGLFCVRGANVTRLFSGSAEAIGESRGVLIGRDAHGHEWLAEGEAIPDQREALLRIVRIISDSGLPVPDAVGHRIVHGGPSLLRHCLIDATVVARLEAAAPFAPLHVPQALDAFRFAQQRFPGVPHAACFDTAFHANLPRVARVLPVARELESRGFRRYGFHGLSCESILRRLGDEVPQRLVIAHLGSGASVTAVECGAPIDTSMGLTPTGGVVMSTRSGDLDPGAVVYLLREKKLDSAALEELLDRRSGLLSVSGLSGDMRTLRAAASSNADARLAADMFCHSVRKQIAAMAAVLGGLDMLVFTGGIGENDPQSRLEICSGLQYMGVVLDDERNRRAQNPLNCPDMRCMVLALPSQEEEQIAHVVSALLGPGCRPE